MDSRCRYLLEVSSKAFSRKYSWDRLAQDICEQFYPIRADYTTTIDYDDFSGWLSDGFPVQARETLGNLIDSMLRQGQWFRMSTGDDELNKRPAVAATLQKLTRRVRGLMYDKRSNWDIASKEGDHDWVTVGNPVYSIEAAETRDHLVYRSWHPRDCAWMCDEFNRPDTMFRKFSMTARNVQRKFDSGSWKGENSPNLMRLAEQDPGQEVRLMHILMPTMGLYGDAISELRNKRSPFLSIYIDLENKSYLNEAPANVFNYVIPRQRVLADKPWGFSPLTLNALADARMLQDMSLVLLEQGQKAVDPPVVVSGSVFTRDFNAWAGGVTEVDLEAGQKLGDAMEVLDTSQRMNIGMDLKADVRNLIAESMLLNKLMLPNVREMREMEVMVRTEEFRRAALPFFMPIQSQMHEPLLVTTFQMAVNMRMIRGEEIPAEMQNSRAEWSFTSPLNEADARVELDKFNQAVQTVATGAQIDQTVGTLFNARKATEDAVIALDRPEWLVPEKMRKQKAEEAEIAKQLGQAAEIAQRGAGAVSDVANASVAAQQAGMV